VKKSRQEIIHCGDIFVTHLPLSVSCIGLTKGVPKFGIQHGEHYNKGKTFGHLKIGGLQGLLSLLITPKETTDTASSASFFDLYLEFDDSGQSITF
jgi:hypothetical protein